MISIGVVGILILFAIKGEKITIKGRTISSITSSNIGMIIAGYVVIELMLKDLNYERKKSDRSSSLYALQPLKRSAIEQKSLHSMK